MFFFCSSPTFGNSLNPQMKKKPFLNLKNYLINTELNLILFILSEHDQNQHKNTFEYDVHEAQIILTLGWTYFVHFAGTVGLNTCGITASNSFM